MDCKDARNRYMRAMQLGLIDAGSSTCSLSVLLSTVETSLRTRTALEIAQGALAGIISRHIHAPRILAAAATIWGRRLFCGVCSSTCSLSVLLSPVEISLRTRTALEWALAVIISMCVRRLCILPAATIQGRCLFRSELPIMRLLFKGGDYSRAVSEIQ